MGASAKAIKIETTKKSWIRTVASVNGSRAFDAVCHSKMLLHVHRKVYPVKFTNVTHPQDPGKATKLQ